jgi:hypothetical protein
MIVFRSKWLDKIFEEVLGSEGTDKYTLIMSVVMLELVVLAKFLNII